MWTERPVQDSRVSCMCFHGKWACKELKVNNLRNGLTSSSIESTTTAVAFEVLGLLVRDEQLQILKVALA